MRYDPESYQHRPTVKVIDIKSNVKSTLNDKRSSHYDIHHSESMIVKRDPPVLNILKNI